MAINTTAYTKTWINRKPQSQMSTTCLGVKNENYTVPAT